MHTGIEQTGMALTTLQDHSCIKKKQPKTSISIFHELVIELISEFELPFILLFLSGRFNFSLIFNVHTKIVGKYSWFATKPFKNIEIITFLAEFLLLSVLQKSLFHYGKNLFRGKSPPFNWHCLHSYQREKKHIFRSTAINHCINITGIRKTYSTFAKRELQDQAL